MMELQPPVPNQSSLSDHEANYRRVFAWAKEEIQNALISGKWTYALDYEIRSAVRIAVNDAMHAQVPMIDAEALFFGNPHMIWTDNQQRLRDAFDFQVEVRLDLIQQTEQDTDYPLQQVDGDTTLS